MNADNPLALQLFSYFYLWLRPQTAELPMRRRLIQSLGRLGTGTWRIYD